MNDQVAGAAGDVAELVAQIPRLSPPGSNIGKTRIKTEVWENFGRYKEFSAQSAKAARTLASVAKAGDRAAIVDSFKALSKSCSKCHRPYRKKKEKKR